MPYTHRSLVLLLATAACTRNVPASTPPPGGASQKLEIASSGHLLVTATIEGRPYVFVLDTGASITSLSTEAARELAIARTGSMQINDTIVAPTGTLRSLAISGVDLGDVPVAIVDIPDALASGAKGILGLDVLARHDIVVDFVDGEFGVYPAGIVASSGRALVRLDYGANGLILLDVVLADRTTVPAMLDLGAPVSVLNSSAGLLIGSRRNATQIVTRTGDTTLNPVHMLVRDLGTFARLGLAHRPAIVLGSDAFEDRLLAISYRDRVAFVSRGSGRD
jgi:Aspartyl protease